MTDSFQGYLIRVIAAAIICAIIKSFIVKPSVSGSIIKTLCNVFLVLTILSTLLNLDFNLMGDYIDDFAVSSDEAVQAGSQMQEEALRSSIKQYSEAYVLDKAASMKAALSVEVTLSNDNPPVPVSIVLEGSVSPYAKSKLIQLITDDLGISKENQIWK